MPKNPKITLLDPGQIIKRVYDEDNDQIRTTIDASINVAGQQTLVITDVVDSIKIGNGSGTFLDVNPDGSINVNVVNQAASNSNEVSTYNEVSSVASGITTLITTYTVPALKTASIQRVSVSGENIARWDVLVNDVIVDTRRTFFGNLNEYFDFTNANANGPSLVPGNTIKVKVLHNRPMVGTFESRIQVTEIG